MTTYLVSNVALQVALWSGLPIGGADTGAEVQICNVNSIDTGFTMDICWR